MVDRARARLRVQALNRVLLPVRVQARVRLRALVRVQALPVVCLVALFLFLPASIMAEIRSSVQLDFRNGLAINPHPDNLDLRYLVSGSGKLSFTSSGNRNVKGHLSIIANISPQSQSINVDRAYIITRFDPLRVTLGKTRTSWGEGAVFNAADLVLGASDLNVNLNLSSGEFRNQSVWMGALRLSLDRFAFLETVILPPQPDPFKDKIALGGRFLAELSEVALKLETGYFYRGNEDRHNAYFSLHGGEILNWHLSTSLALDSTSVSGTAEDFFKGLKASGGLFFLNNIGSEGNDLNLGLRAELLLNLGGEFSEKAQSTYGLYGFLEASLGIDRNINVYLRSIISPIDGSALLIAGAGFKIYQGFTLYSDALVQFGDNDDTFINHSLGGYAINAGFRFIF